MSERLKLRVEIESPEYGWTHVELSAGNEFYEFFPSDVPLDSIKELANAILEILNGKTEAKVYWNDEPVIHNLFFIIRNERCEFKVYEVFESVAGETLIERFSFEGTLYEVLCSFWKGLCDLKSKQSLEEYERQWGNPFPTNEIFEIKQKLKDIMSKQR